MALIEAGMGGTLGGQHRIRQQIDVVGQEIGNNRTLIQYSAWLERVISGSRVWNYDPTPGVTNINGYAPGRAINGYDSRSAGQRWYMAQNEQYWIGHDGNGDANPYFRADYDARNPNYLTSGWCAGNVWMPHINRFTNITRFDTSNVSDVGFTINAGVDSMANFLRYSLEDGVGWRDQFGGNFYNYSFALGGNFPSNKAYNLRISVRRADSGLWTDSGVIGVITKGQSGFVNPMGL